MPKARRLDPSRLGDHVDRLYRAAWALCGSPEGAEDLVQETYMRVLARPRFLHSEDDLGYLLRVLRNTFASELRAQRRRPLTDPLEGRAEIADGRVSSQPPDLVEAKAVYGAIASLDDGFRAVLVAVDVVGLSYDETARALRLREGTVMSRLFRARQQVARMLADERPAAASASSERGAGRSRSPA